MAAHQLPFTYVLDELDLSSARRRFLSTLDPAYPKLHTLMADRVEAEYRKFLVLKVAHGDTHAHLLAAPDAIHTFWGCHAIDTASYFDMLDRLGMRIHYTPDMGVGTTRVRLLLNAVDCYKARFDMGPPVGIWGASKDAEAGHAVKHAAAAPSSESEEVGRPAAVQRHGPASDPRPAAKQDAMSDGESGTVAANKDDKTSPNSRPETNWTRPPSTGILLPHRVQLFVRYCTGIPTQTILLHEDVTLFAIKVLIWERSGIPPPMQRMGVGTTYLYHDAHFVVRDYHLEHGSHLRLNLRWGV